jgi:hypothetical protein
MENVADGEISATFSMTGRGRAGVVARENGLADTGYNLWVDPAGEIGATREAAGYPRDLFVLPDPAVLRGGLFTLSMQISGASLSFYLDGQLVRRYTDRLPFPAGNWGVIVDARYDQGAVTARYQRVTLTGSEISPVNADLVPGPFTARVDYAFAAGNSGLWWSNAYAHSNRRVEHGSYILSANDNFWEAGSTTALSPFATGQIGATFTREGPGKTGVIARNSTARDGFQSGYAFWIDEFGTVGLTRIQDNRWLWLSLSTAGALSPGVSMTLALRV